MAVVEFDRISKAWGDTVTLDDINLHIDDGEFVAVLGPSGCGKTTTLFLLAGVYAPTSGEIRFDGHRINEVEARDRNVGIVFQSYALYPNMNVYENIRFPLRYQKQLDKAAQRKKVGELASMVEVEHLLQRKPSQLSGGQQQRVALARALIKNPNLLLLDEPLSNLDATLRLSMRSEIRDLQRRTGVTSLLVTHDQIEAMTMADRVICMDAGRIAQVATPQAIYNQPDNLFVARFVGAPPINILDASLEESCVQVGNTRWQLDQAIGNASVVFGIRPEHVHLSNDDSGIPGEIRRVEPMGRETMYTLASEMGELRLLCNESVPSRSLRENVKVAIEQDHCLLFDGDSEHRIAATLHRI